MPKTKCLRIPLRWDFLFLLNNFNIIFKKQSTLKKGVDADRINETKKHLIGMSTNRT